jgi:DNA-binding NarL/FixJ family response regulator
MDNGSTRQGKSDDGAAPSIRVGIVEDMSPIREGLAALIEGTEGFTCVGQWGTMEKALDEIGLVLPQVALIDIGLPGMSGIEGIRILREKHPDVCTLVLSVYEDDERVFEALCAGATGYLVKKTPPARLLENLKEAVAGGSPMSPEIARRVIRLFREFRPQQPANYALTPHELRLLGLLVEGHHYKTAADALGVTSSTVSFHLQNIYRKLHVQSKAEAVVKALREGLIR